MDVSSLSPGPCSWIRLTPWLAPLALVYAIWVWSGELAGLGGDNAFYLLTAGYFSPWGDPGELAGFFAAESGYPPLFSGVLGLTGGGVSVRIAHLTVAAALIGALWLYAALLARAGASRWLVLGLPLVFGLLPGTMVQTLFVHSETTYLLLSLGALLVLGEGARAPPLSYPATIGLTLLLAAALLTRTAGVALLAAAFLSVMRTGIGPRLLILAGAALPALGWRWLGEQAGAGYVSDWLARTSPLAAVPLSEQPELYRDLLLQAWRRYLFGSLSGVEVPAALLLSAGVVGAAWRALRAHPDGLYAGLYLVMVAVWAYVWPGELVRLLLPLVPLLLFHAHWAIGTGLSRLSPAAGRWVHPALLAVWVVGLAPAASHALERFVAPLPGHLEPYRRVALRFEHPPELADPLLVRHAAMVSALRDLGEHVPEGACIYAPKPSVVGHYGGRPSRPPPRGRVGPDEFWEQLAADRCRYVLGFNWATPTFPAPFYPLPRMEGRAKVLQVWKEREDGEPLVVLARW